MFSNVFKYTVPASSPALTEIKVNGNYAFLDSSLVIKRNNVVVASTEYTVNPTTRIVTFDNPLVEGDEYVFRQPNYGYHAVIRKVSAVFGTMFNDILVKMKDQSNVELASVQVPLAYGPAQKYLARLRQNNSLDNDLDGDDGKQVDIRMTLPRMSFELTGINYDATRQKNRNQTIVPCQTTGTEAPWTWEQVPFTLEFTLFIMTKKYDEGLQIIEQIVPYFAPSITVPIETIPLLEQTDNVVFKLEGISPETNYEGNFEEMEYIQWTLSFIVECYLYRPNNISKIINDLDINTTNWTPDLDLC